MYKKSSKPLISAKEISERLDTLGKDVAAFGCDIVITVLSGGFMFSADICKRIATPKLQLAFIRASSYGNGTESSGNLKITGLENIDIRDKKVLVIDDILDTGNTMFGVKQALNGMGAKEIKTCVLLDKPARRTANITADFVGFEVENKFVVGYGLDYAGDYRTYPEIWTMEEDDGQ